MSSRWRCGDRLQAALGSGGRGCCIDENITGSGTRNDVAFGPSPFAVRIPLTVVAGTGLDSRAASTTHRTLGGYRVHLVSPDKNPQSAHATKTMSSASSVLTDSPSRM